MTTRESRAHQTGEERQTPEDDTRRGEKEERRIPKRLGDDGGRRNGEKGDGNIGTKTRDKRKKYCRWNGIKREEKKRKREREKTEGSKESEIGKRYLNIMYMKKRKNTRIEKRNYE